MRFKTTFGGGTARLKRMKEPPVMPFDQSMAPEQDFGDTYVEEEEVQEEDRTSLGVSGTQEELY